MLVEILMGVFSIAMIVGGVAMVRSPETFIVDANPTLALMRENLPDWVARLFVQGLGGFVAIAFVAYFLFEFVF